MKKIALIFTAIYLMSMGACFSPWDGSGGQGTIVINLGNGGARAASGDSYTVILTNSGATSIIQPITGGSAAFSVQPGDWNILVRRADSAGNLNGYGETDVAVMAGATANAIIRVGKPEEDVTEVVNAWTDLKRVLEKEGKKEGILLTRNLLVNTYIQIGKNSNITLLAAKPITIIKDNFANYSLFRVPSGSLTLGKEKEGMSGTITIDGSGGNKTDNSSLIYVGKKRITGLSEETDTGGTLTMYDRVTLTNNIIAGIKNNSERGGAVTVDGGTFNMHGGIISRNTASYGGGVRVLSGTFTKNGGTIYGSNGDDKSNTAATDDKGHAVYLDTTATAHDKTLLPENILP